MAEIAPPTPPSPKAAASAIKGKITGRPKWQYVVFLAVAGGVTYYVIMKRRAAPDETAQTDSIDATTTDTSGQVAEPYSPYVTPSATQGAYYGYDTPYSGSTVAAGAEPGSSMINLSDLSDFLGVLSASTNPVQVVQPTPSPAPTGGGAETRPNPAVVNGGTPPAGGTCPTSHPYYDPTHKVAKPWGCYRVVIGSAKCPSGKKDHWNYFYDGAKVHVGCK
jgi:hypothetical protein